MHKDTHTHTHTHTPVMQKVFGKIAAVLQPIRACRGATVRADAALMPPFFGEVNP
jgi:hypothetical protein